MTTNATTMVNGELPPFKKSRAMRGNGQTKGKPVSRRSAKQVSAVGASAGGYGRTASQLMSRGKTAAQGAYEWAADSAGRALPLAARHMPDQRSMKKMFDERPYILGIIGFGIGAAIGMMLPARMKGGAISPSPRTARRVGGKRG